MKLSDEQVEAAIRKAQRRVTDAAHDACFRSDDPEQRFQIITTLAASLFGSAGAAFQDFNPQVSKEEAARAALAHIGSLLGAYTN